MDAAMQHTLYLNHRVILHYIDYVYVHVYIYICIVAMGAAGHLGVLWSFWCFLRFSVFV